MLYVHSLVACEFKGQKSTGGGGSGNEAIKRTRDKIMIYSIPHDAPGA